MKKLAAAMAAVNSCLPIFATAEQGIAAPQGDYSCNVCCKRVFRVELLRCMTPLTPNHINNVRRLTLLIARSIRGGGNTGALIPIIYDVKDERVTFWKNIL